VKKTYAIVGAGGRGIGMFAKPLLTDLSEYAQLVAMVDSNPVRLANGVKGLASANSGKPVRQFTDFDRMLREVDPDGVIIATRDSTHADYIVRTLRAGKRAFSEKPLCTTAGQCREILAAVEETGQTCLCTHNMRYGFSCRSMRSVILNGWLGKVISIEFAETLDRCHGGDYFRRWHCHKANTGGLQIHKASHHFDFLNWCAMSRPATVRAQGGLKFYGRNNSFHGKRCSDCPHTKRCEFYADVFANDKWNQDMYRAAEGEDGYFRDGCVWDPTIDIEDQLFVHIEYENGILANYSLNAFSPLETMRVVIEGTNGRLEDQAIHNTNWVPSNTRLPGVEKMWGETQRLFLQNQGLMDLPLATPEGEHGGADPQLRQDFFARSWDLPPNAFMASVEQAVQAVLVGAAVNKSLANGGATVYVQDLLKKD
jgi:predicted dehydrogenase